MKKCTEGIHLPKFAFVALYPFLPYPSPPPPPHSPPLSQRAFSRVVSLTLPRSPRSLRGHIFFRDRVGWLAHYCNSRLPSCCTVVCCRGVLQRCDADCTFQICLLKKTILQPTLDIEFLKTLIVVHDCVTHHFITLPCNKITHGQESWLTTVTHLTATHCTAATHYSITLQ